MKFFKKEPVVILQYESWKDDFGYLEFVIELKKQIGWSSKLDVLTTIPIINSNTPSLIDDSILNEVVSSIVENVLMMISKKYETFLVDKYFRDKNALIKYITDIVYYDTTKYAIQKNSTSIIKNKENSDLNLNRKKLSEQMVKKELKTK